MNARICAVCFVLTICTAIPATAEEVVNLSPRPGVTLNLLLAEVPNAEAVALLLPGGHGKLGLTDNGRPTNLRGNFLLRSRNLFGARKIATAVFDAPSDRRDDTGLSFTYRMSGQHARDVLAAAAWLNIRFGLPVWLIGTSRGSTSAANTASRAMDGAIDGLVLTSAVGVHSRHGGNVMDLELDNIRAPTLVVHHKNDGCGITPFAGAEDIALSLTNTARSDLLAFDGGIPGGNACAGHSHHGFLGIEDKVVDAIVRWMLGK